MKAPFRRAALCASIFATLAPAALAQIQLEEIIVTATKRTASRRTCRFPSTRYRA